MIRSKLLFERGLGLNNFLRRSHIKIYQPYFKSNTSRRLYSSKIGNDNYQNTNYKLYLTLGISAGIVTLGTSATVLAKIKEESDLGTSTNNLGNSTEKKKVKDFDPTDLNLDEESEVEKKFKLNQLPFAVKCAIFGGAVALLVGFNLVTVPFLWTARSKFGGIPFSVTTVKQLDTIFAVLPTKSLQGKHLVDLGSGSGTIIIESAYRGIRSTGYEINPWLIKRSLKKAKDFKLDDIITVKNENFWKSDLRDAQVITFFGIGKAMKRFQDLLDNDLQVSPGTHIVSISFKLPNWKPYDEEDGVYFYLKNEGNNHVITEEEEKRKQKNDPY